MEQPLVSIALCTYNGERFLREQLDSIFNQSYPNIEVVAVDDGSTDRTVEIIQSYARRYTNLSVYLNDSNLGYIKNFEKAIALCKGDYIALSDQDDIWHEDKIKLQISEIGRNLLIYHDSEFINEDNKPLGRKLSNVVKMYAGDSYKPFLLFNCVSGHQCLFHKALIELSFPFPTEIFHDRWLAFAATSNGSIKYLDNCLVSYRQHTDSDTDILKLKDSKDKNATHGIAKIEKTLIELRIFANYQSLQQDKFINKFVRLYETRLKSFLCFRLMIFMYAHFNLLLYISHKSLLSKLNFVFKHIWGAKLKS